MSITTSSISLPAEISAAIISNAQKQSAIMQLARRIPLPGRGAVVPVITADPTAYFVDEGSAKTNSDATLTAKTMKPRTIAIIEPFSNQFRNNYPALFDELVNRLPGVLAERFDKEVFQGSSVTGFDTLATATAVSLASDLWGGLVAARAAVEAADGELNGWALSNQGITTLLDETDGNDRPLFTRGVDSKEYGEIIGAPVVKARKSYSAATSSAAEVLGFAGDWTKALWGMVDDVQIAISDQASLTMSDSSVINLFERNMFAVRVEFEVSFATAFSSQFVKLTGTPATGA